MPERTRGALVVRLWLAAVAIATVAGCSSGIVPDRDSPRATIRAYEEQVADLERQLDEQGVALTAAAGPPSATPTPPPSFAERWRIEVAGPTEMRPQVGIRDGLTPLAADGQFLVVPIRVTNLGSAPSAFNPFADLAVVDGQDRRFEPDADASGAAYLLDFGYPPAFGVRQPGIPFMDVLVFDVPTDAAGFTLVSEDGSVAIGLDR